MELFKVNGRLYAAGLEWKEIRGNSDSTLKRKMKKEVLNKEKEYFHGVYLNNFKLTKKSQYFSSHGNKVFFSNKIYAGAAFFVENFKGYVILKKIKEYKESGVNKILYWFLAIDDEGLIVEDITISDDSVEGKIAEYAEIYYKIAIYKNDYKFYSNEIEADKRFNESVFVIQNENSPSHLFTYYKKDDYSAIYKSVLFFGLVVIAGGAFFTQYETSEKVRLENFNYKPDVSEYVNTVDAWIKAQEDISDRSSRKGSSPRYTQDEFTDFGKKQVQSLFDSQRYSNETILSNIIEIEQTIPLYLAEWELTGLSYYKNVFVIAFDKIGESNGVFTEIDHIMDRYDDEYAFRIIPYSLESEATKRIYMIEFDNVKKSVNSGQYVTLFEFREKQLEYVEEILTDIKKSENRINNIKNEVSKLSTFEQVFTDKLALSEQKIQNEIGVLKNLYKDAIKEIQKEPENYEVDFDLSKMTQMRYVERTQINTNYDWIFPSDKKSYPNIKKSSLNYYADSYKVGASSIDNLSNNFESMLDAGDQLTGLNTIIYSVSYDVKSGDWEIVGELFELPKNIEKE